MKIYYDPNQYPELASLPRQERSRLWHEFIRSLGFLDWRTLLAAGVFFLFMFAGYGGMGLIDIWLPGDELLACALWTACTIIGLLACVVTIMTLQRQPFEDFVKERTANHTSEGIRRPADGPPKPSM